MVIRHGQGTLNGWSPIDIDSAQGERAVVAEGEQDVTPQPRPITTQAVCVVPRGQPGLVATQARVGGPISAVIIHHADSTHLKRVL